MTASITTGFLRNLAIMPPISARLGLGLPRAMTSGLRAPPTSNSPIWDCGATAWIHLRLRSLMGLVPEDASDTPAISVTEENSPLVMLDIANLARDLLPIDGLARIA